MVAKRNDHARKVRRIKKEIRVLARFIRIFCERNHSDNDKALVQASGKAGEFLEGEPLRLCSECKKLLLHAVGKTIMCPYDPKPRCKKCPTHCYAGGYRERIKKVMRFSGAYLLKRGRLDLAFKYFL